MTQTQQHKIIILDDNQQRRDALKSMVVEWGHTPFIFEKESRCLDNLKPLDPDLVISCSLSVDKASRFIHTLQLTRSGMPVVIISDDRAIQEFVETNGFGGVSVLNVALDPTQVQKAILQVLKENNRGKSQQYCPLIVGKSPTFSIKIPQQIKENDCWFGQRQRNRFDSGRARGRQGADGPLYSSEIKTAGRSVCKIECAAAAGWFF